MDLQPEFSEQAFFYDFTQVHFKLITVLDLSVMLSIGDLVCVGLERLSCQHTMVHAY